MLATLKTPPNRATRAGVRGLKNRTGVFCRRPATRAPVFGSQMPKLRRVAKLAATKSASGPSLWPSRDPIEENGGVNLYGYVNNDPINLFDPYGLDWLDNAANFSAGFGDTLSFGLTRRGRQAMGYDDAVDKCSDAYSGGEWSGIGASLLMGGGGILKGGAQGLKTLLYDPRKFASISKAFWRAEGGAAGRALHHWLIPQSAGGIVPSGILNAGWNQVVISGRLNTYMGFAQNWGGISPYVAGALENGIRAAIIGTLGAPITAATGMNSGSSPK